jgi:hypothetical protein
MPLTYFTTNNFFVEEVNLVLQVDGELLGNQLIWHSFLLPSFTAEQNSKFCLAASITFAKV